MSDIRLDTKIVSIFRPNPSQIVVVLIHPYLMCNQVSLHAPLPM